MARYNVHPGIFPCHTCKEEVTTIRSYLDIKKLTWMCKSGHLSEVDLNTRKSKKDYERKVRK
jgi:hypothetical protein